MATTTNIIIESPSLSGANFKEGIDLGLVCAAFDQQVNLLFIDAGINNLITGQSAAKLNDRNHSDIIKGLEFYDIDNIYLEKESLDRSCLNIENLLPSVQLKTTAEINRLNRIANHLVIF